MVFVGVLLLGALSFLVAMQTPTPLRMYSKDLGKDTPYMLITRDHHTCLMSEVLDMTYLSESIHPLSLETGLLFLQGAVFSKLIADLPMELLPEVVTLHLRPVPTKATKYQTKLSQYRNVPPTIFSHGYSTLL